jgi:hypothetical protein
MVRGVSRALAVWAARLTGLARPHPTLREYSTALGTPPLRSQVEGEIDNRVACGILMQNQGILLRPEMERNVIVSIPS